MTCQSSVYNRTRYAQSTLSLCYNFRHYIQKEVHVAQIAPCSLFPAPLQPKAALMFTGLIREMATVKRYAGNILTLRADYRPAIGDSVAVNGVCLTVTALHADGFDVELADETREVIDEGRLSGQVHIEPAMQMGDRFEGHIVQGHVDCMGEIVAITPRSNGTDYRIRLPHDQMAYVIPKGSITVDGVSLTVNDVGDDAFRLTIIPHTIENTLFKTYRVGTHVNIETDFFARYIEHILSHRDSKKGLSWKEVDGMSMSF